VVAVPASLRNCPAEHTNPFRQFNSASAVYKDNVQAYSNVEAAIDLTASSPLAFARQALGLY